MIPMHDDIRQANLATTPRFENANWKFIMDKFLKQQRWKKYFSPMKTTRRWQRCLNISRKRSSVVNFECVKWLCIRPILFSIKRPIKMKNISNLEILSWWTTRFSGCMTVIINENWQLDLGNETLSYLTQIFKTISQDCDMKWDSI